MEDVRDRAPACKAEIVIPKRSRGRQSVAAQLAYQEQVAGRIPDTTARLPSRNLVARLAARQSRPTLDAARRRGRDIIVGRKS
jgi:hypothetical protein